MRVYRIKIGKDWQKEIKFKNYRDALDWALKQAQEFDMLHEDISVDQVEEENELVR